MYLVAKVKHAKDIGRIISPEKEIAIISPLKRRYDKTNIGMLGNVVSQLHLHLVLRKKSDPAWPHPVCGYNFKNKLDENSKTNRSNLILKFLK